jgi:AraC-like DNA-binding protein
MDLSGLVFGWRTAVLSVAAAIILPIALALFAPLTNRAANRFLALLLLVLAGVFTPWMIGFAGFYDRWRWLTFLPVAIPLLGPPLLWLYVAALARGRAPERYRRHLLPGLIQFAWQATGFFLPLPIKLRWADLTNPASSLAFSLALIASFAAYGLASWRELEAYRAGLALTRSDDGRFAARWLSRTLAACGVLAVVWTVYAVWDLISPLGYKGLMGLYAALAGIAVYLAIEGWRNAAVPFPAIDATPETAPEPERDWSDQGAIWLERIRAEGWHRQADLSLHRAARLLGTNTAYLSRAFNQGLGQNFSRAVNRLRCEAVAEGIARRPAAPILDLALEAGFSSKASFNRAFQDRYGMTPQAMRREAQRLKV